MASRYSASRFDAGRGPSISGCSARALCRARNATPKLANRWKSLCRETKQASRREPTAMIFKSSTMKECSWRDGFPRIAPKATNQFSASRFSDPAWQPASRASRAGHLADSRIFGEDEFAGAQCRFLEIRLVGGKHLPARYFLPQYFNGPHARGTRVAGSHGAPGS